jgi:Ca-activated chloride channel family protein
MKRRAAIRDLMVAGAASFLSRLLPESLRGDEQDYLIRSEVRLVLLDVSVKDRAGGFVEGLSKDSFHVSENGRPQNVTVFASKDLPVTAGILVDESQSMTPKRAEVLSAAERFIEESNPHDEIFVLSFNDEVRPGLPTHVRFSDNAEQLRSALHRGTPKGRTALNDAVVDGLQQLKLGRRDKKTLVLISDGGDNASRHTRKEMLDSIERSIATVYAIGLFDAGDPDRDPGILKQLARISGGDAYFPVSPSDMAAACHRIAKDIRTRYTIGYQPQANNGGVLRRIEVRVSAPGHASLVARTRTRYRYEEAQNRNDR